jgi:hypothetical protein
VRPGSASSAVAVDADTWSTGTSKKESRESPGIAEAVLGNSMGAAAVIEAAPELTLVRALVAGSAYANLSSAIQGGLTRYAKLPGRSPCDRDLRGLRSAVQSQPGVRRPVPAVPGAPLPPRQPRPSAGPDQCRPIVI